MAAGEVDTSSYGCDQKDAPRNQHQKPTETRLLPRGEAGDWLRKVEINTGFAAIGEIRFCHIATCVHCRRIMLKLGLGKDMHCETGLAPMQGTHRDILQCHASNDAKRQVSVAVCKCPTYLFSLK